MRLGTRTARLEGGGALVRADAKGLLKSAIRDPNPVIVSRKRNAVRAEFDVPDSDDFVVPIGKAKIERPGKDVTIVAYSIAVGIALEAAEKLAAEGIDAEVINLRTIRPMDTETIIESVKKTNRVVTVGEGWPTCGIGAEVSAVVIEQAFDYLDAPRSGCRRRRADAICCEPRKTGAAKGRMFSRPLNPFATPKGGCTMPIKVLMPALSPTMTEGNLAKWVVKEGDTVESGDVMAEIETDKATMEVEAVDEGTIGQNSGRRRHRRRRRQRGHRVAAGRRRRRQRTRRCRYVFGRR